MLAQILAAISAIRQFVQWGIDLFAAIRLWLQERKQSKKNEKLKAAEAKLRAANEMQDEQQRLKEKAEAIHDIEDSLRH